MQLGARYDGSAIVAATRRRRPTISCGYTPSAVPGGRAPHAWPGEGRGTGDSLYDRLGPGLTLLRLGPRAPEAHALSEAAKRRGIPLTILDLPDADIRDLYERDLALIRPDQHVAWRGNALPDDADALLARVTGR